MKPRKLRNGRSPRRFSLPRWAAVALAPVIWLVAIPLGHGVLPWAMSRLGPRYGWVANTPRTWNWLALVPVSAGVTILIWVMILGFAHAVEVPEHVELNWSPKVLLTDGPYRFSRHPIYLAELALWFGWVLFYGNLFVLAGFVVVMLVVNVLVPREEQALEAQFGDSYRRYQATVHRWVGLPPS